MDEMRMTGPYAMTERALNPLELAYLNFQVESVMANPQPLTLEDVVALLGQQGIPHL